MNTPEFQKEIPNQKGQWLSPPPQLENEMKKRQAIKIEKNLQDGKSYPTETHNNAIKIMNKIHKVHLVSGE